MSWCEAEAIEYIFGLSGNATLAAQVQTLEGRTAARYAARCTAEPPKFKLRRYMDFRGGAKSWNCQRRMAGRSRTRWGRHPLHRHQPDRPPGAAALRAEILPERPHGEPAEASSTWPPIGPPAREPAPTKSGSFCMAPPIGCSGPSRASCRSGRPGAWPSSTPCATG